MRHEAHVGKIDSAGDVSIPGGCLLCGGDLHVRITSGAAASYCTTCRWLSRPHMHRNEEGAVHVVHPAGGLA